MKIALLLTAAALLLTPAAYAQEARLEINTATVERGRDLFASNCNACHGLKYYRDREHREGWAPLMDAKSAEETFGTVPPDLSLMASARGKGRDGALYIHELLTGYYTDRDGKVKNRAFAKETETEGVTAMPQPIPGDDPELDEKARDVAAFLYTVSEPSETERRSLGKYVMGYMVVMTALLFTINRLTWKRVKKGLER